METGKNYLLIGTFVFATLLAGAVFSLWLVGQQDKGKYTPYLVRFADSVSGLDVGGPVKYRGVVVGKIDAIAIDPADIRLIRVDLSLLKTTPIKTDTIASLRLQGITGTAYVELSGTTSQAADLRGDASSDTPPEIPSQPSSIDAIITMMPELLKKLSAIGDQVNKALSDRNIASFSDMMMQWQKTSHDLSDLARGLKEDPSQILSPHKEKGIPAP